MFSLKVTEDEIQLVYGIVSEYEYPRAITRYDIALTIFKKSDELSQRKVRLCIIELRKRGHLIIASNGYSMAGNDAEPSIHFVNGLYSRANKLKSEADNMYWLIKKKYGNKACEKIEALPGQSPLIIAKDGKKITMLDILDNENEI